jgi:4-amino-4-deoxy-L-arabinose transferase-like glycosyltransferase
LFALVIRLAVLAATYPDENQVPYFEDVAIAINLLEGKGYVLNFTMLGQAVPLRPTAAKPPVYPALAVVVFFVFGMKNFVALFVVHAVLAACTCVLLYLSMAKFSHSRAMIAGGAFAVYPPFIYHSVTVPESTTLTLFLIALFCYGLINLQRSFVQSRWVLISVIAGVLALTEPVTVPFIFLSLAYIAYDSVDRNRSFQMIIAVAAFAATLAPWTVRNYFAFNRFVFIKSNFGSTLKDSMYLSGMRLPEETYSSLKKQVEGANEVEEDRAVKKALVSWLVENPAASLRLLAKNFQNFWWEVDRYKSNRSTTYILGRKVPYVVLLIFSIPAMFWTLGRLATKKLWMDTSIYHHMMLLLILTYTAVYTVIGPMNLRYHFPVELAMFVFSADTIQYVTDRLRVRSTFTAYQS